MEGNFRRRKGWRTKKSYRVGAGVLASLQLRRQACGSRQASGTKPWGGGKPGGGGKPPYGTKPWGGGKPTPYGTKPGRRQA